MCLFSLFFHSVLVFLFLFCSFFLLLCCSFFLVPLSTPLSCFVAEPSMESWVLPITAGPMTETQKLSFTVWHWPLLLPTCMLHVAVEGLSACMWLLLLLFKPPLRCFQKKLVGFNVSSLLICCQIWNLYNLIVLWSFHKQGEVLSTYEDFFCMIAMDTEPDCFAATLCRLVLGNVTTTQLSLRTPFCRSWLVVIALTFTASTPSQKDSGLVLFTLGGVNT